ncbi:hypothetical protein AB0D67_35805 [Streptosporangium sp. NPDC048047]|uniref:hypothetical protein n=1 Tax=Streptosporangium sp. NPDC048047 TaxID=3155748 RepID=UPI00343E8AE0
MKRMVMGAVAAGLGIGVGSWLRWREQAGTARNREAAERWNRVTVDAESLVETGEVPQPDRPGTDRPTVTGEVSDAVTRRADGEGRR